MGGFPEHNLLVHGWNLLVDTVLQTSGCSPPTCRGFSGYWRARKSLISIRVTFFFFSSTRAPRGKKTFKNKADTVTQKQNWTRSHLHLICVLGVQSQSVKGRQQSSGNTQALFTAFSRSKLCLSLALSSRSV